MLNSLNYIFANAEIFFLISKPRTGGGLHAREIPYQYVPYGLQPFLKERFLHHLQASRKEKISTSLSSTGN